MTSLMNHMDYLERVQADDLSEVRRKEQTYQGSWKRRGGVGAAMMALRKCDRLEVMLRERNWDAFSNVGDGSDGTLIAEIRDLRRYLLLIESEIVSRGLWGSGTHRALPMPANSGSEERRSEKLNCSRLQDGMRLLDFDEVPLRYLIRTPSELYIVNRSVAPPESWEHLPRLDLELNGKELSDLPEYYRGLYEWVPLGDDYGKHVLIEDYRENWGKEV